MCKIVRCGLLAETHESSRGHSVRLEIFLQGGREYGRAREAEIFQVRAAARERSFVPKPFWCSPKGVANNKKLADLPYFRPPCEISSARVGPKRGCGSLGGGKLRAWRVGGFGVGRGGAGFLRGFVAAGRF